MKREPFRILSLVMDQPWAITSRALETILETMERPASDLEAVAARLGRPLDNTGNRVETRGSTAILGVEGPLFRYANLFTAISGATSVEMLSQDLESALQDPAIERIVLNVNSPGGQVDGINELADMIRAGNSRKPVIAYVDGLAASAAYWIASAAGQIVANESAFLGSIGVVAAISDSRSADEKRGVKRYEIVSSQSPRKRPDPATEAGRGQILEQVDALAQLFIDRVAGFRGASSDQVVDNFGRGGVLPARAAQAAGMIDGLGSYEGLLRDLNHNPAGGSRFAATQEEPPMADNPAAPAPPTPATPPDARTHATERTRIAAILNLEEARGREALARTLALETDHDPETVRRILAAAPTAQAPPAANPLAAAMQQVPNPNVGTGGNEKDELAAEVQSIIAFVPKKHLRAS